MTDLCVSSFNVQNTAVIGQTAGRLMEDESRQGSRHSCSTHGPFIEHLQVFGIISGVVMVIILYSRIFKSCLKMKMKTTILRTG